ncbi:MAG: tandem-95 repeat protein, partial [Planctomycetales bacterium]|nr:tandem-95 repeat protein [Planctomycetales bacterium]
MGKKTGRVIRSRKVRLAKALPLHMVASFEPLEERNLLAAQALASIDGIINDTATFNDIRMIVEQNSGSSYIGLRMHATNGNLNPALPRVFPGLQQDVSLLLNDSDPSNDPNPVHAEFHKANINGTLDSLLVVDLSAGDFTIRVDGDGGAGNYTLEAFLIGDKDANGDVSDFEFFSAGAAQLQDQFGGGNPVSALFFEQMGINMSVDQYDPSFDSNVNGGVDDFDMMMINGNHDDDRVRITLIGDTEAPVIESIDLAEASDTGTLGDMLTTETTVSIDVVTEANATVSLRNDTTGDEFSNPTFVVDATDASKGTYTFANVPLDFADNLMQVTATDTFGNADTSEEIITRNNAPTIDAQTLGPINENSAVDTSVGTVVANDVDIVDGDSLTFAITAGNTDGAFAIDTATGEITVANSAALDFETNPTFTLTVTVTDMGGDGTGDVGAGLSTDGVITINLNNVNDAPVATDDDFSTDEDTQLTGGNLITGDNGNGVDSDEDGNTLVVSAFANTNGDQGTVGQPLTLTDGATVTVNADGTFTYDPTTSTSLQSLPVNNSANSTFTYTISDGNGGTDTATVTINVEGVNDAPVGNDDGDASTDEDTVLNVDATNGVLSNDTDVDLGEQATLVVSQVNGEAANVGSAVTTGKGALITLNADGSFSYDPNGAFESLDDGEQDTDTFTYEVSDVNGATDTATVTVTVTGVNDAPVAVDDLEIATTDEDTEVTINAPGVLANDSDPEGDAISVVSSDTTSTMGATVTVNADGSFTYDPSQSSALNSLNTNESATDSFTYTISDGDETDTATVTVLVTGINDPPVITEGQEFFVSEMASNGAVVGTVEATDPEMEPLTYAIDLIMTNGQAGDTSLFAINASTGQVTINDNGSLTLDDVHVLTITVTDDGNLTDTETITITVVQNLPPTATDNDYSTNEETVLMGNIRDDDTGDGVDSDADGGTLEILEIDGMTANVGTEIMLASGAKLTVNANGSFTYDGSDIPNLGDAETLTDTFEYTLTDNQGGTDTATVTIIVNGENDAPDAMDDGFETDEDTSFSGENLFADNGNGIDMDADDDDFSVTQVNGVDRVDGEITLPSGARITVGSDGTFSYDPTGALDNLPQDAVLTDTFTYTISDGLATDTATVSVVVNGINDAPVATDDEYTTTKSTALMANAMTDDTGNGADSDVDDGDTITLVEVNGEAGDVGSEITLASGATLTINSDGSFDYDPSTAAAFADLEGTDTATDNFSYTISDSRGATDTANVVIRVTADNAPPIATDDSFSTDEDTSFTGASIITADNGNGVDSDPEGGAISLTLVNGTENTFPATITTSLGATVVVEIDGTFSYDPTGSAMLNALAVGENAQDTFTYTISDEEGLTDTATVTITVAGVNDAPTLDNALVDQTAVAEEAFSFTVPGNTFSDPDVNGNAPDDTLTLTAELATGGALPTWLNFDGTTFSGTPGVADEGDVDIRVTASDGNGGSVDDVFRISVFGLTEMQIELIARMDSTPASQYIAFTANPATDNGTGVGRVEIIDDNGTLNLDYSLIRLEGFDFDGTKTPGDQSDDVTSVELRDGTNVIFNIPFANGNDTNELIGTWTAAQGFSQTHIDALRAGTVSAHIVTSSGDIRVGSRNFEVSPEVADLPESITEVLVGQSYVIEVWGRDNDPASNGISSLSAPVTFDSTLSGGDTDPPNGPVDIEDIFTVGASTMFETVGDTTSAQLTGGLLFQQVGVNPGYVLLGTIFVDATGAGTQTYDLGEVTAFRVGNGTAIADNEVLELDVTVEHVAPQSFNVLASSNVTISGTIDGTPVSAQVTGADMTGLGGSIDVLLDSFSNPTSIEFIGSDVQFASNSNGPFNPPAATVGEIENFGITDGTSDQALRDLVIDILSTGALSIDGSGNFSLDSSSWSFSDGQARTRVLGVVNVSDDLIGTSLAESNSGDANLSVSGNTLTLSIPFERTFSFVIGDDSGTANLTIAGTIDAQFVAPAPLVGNEVADLNG